MQPFLKNGVLKNNHLKLSKSVSLHKIYHLNYPMPSQIYLFFTGYELKEAELEEVTSVFNVKFFMKEKSFKCSKKN